MDQAVEQDPVETAIAKPDALLVVFVKRVHRRLPCSRAGNITLPSQPVPADQHGISREKRLASLLCLGLLGMLLTNLVGFPGQPIRAQWRANVVKEV